MAEEIDTDAAAEAGGEANKMSDADKALVRAVANSLWRIQNENLPKNPKERQALWAEKRKEYLPLARKLKKSLEKRGITLLKTGDDADE